MSVADVRRVAGMLVDDLRRLDELVRWAHADGFWPSAPDPTRVAGVNTQDLVGRDADPDAVAGAPRDVGIGSFKARQAFETAAFEIRAADIRAAVVLSSWGRVQPSLRIVTADAVHHLGTVTAELGDLGRRLDLIREEADSVPPPGIRFARVQLTGNPRRSVWGSVDRAVRVLSAVMDRAEVDRGGRRPMCVICSIREPAARTGGRCSTCKTYKDRNNGAERPTSLDGVDRAELLAAQARARTRGEGWGNA